MMEKIDKQKQGKKNKASGRVFELKVRHNLESEGWIVAKWTNNVENGKLVPAKHKFNPFSKVMTMGTGFPDFIAHRRSKCKECSEFCGYEVIGVEAKSNRYLDKAEKDKVEWLLNNHIFAYILIASKSKNKKDGKIIYNQQMKGGTQTK